jgi:hypothetical protein
MVSLGSLQLTLWLIGLLLAIVASVYLLPLLSGSWLALPFALLALNLLAALASNPKFRQQLPLLSFHLALLVLLLLVAVGRLTYLKGWVEVTVGEPFPGALTGQEAGPLHHDRLGEVNFRLEGFTIDYDPGPQRNATHARVQWLNERGVSQRGSIGDHRPLILSGYRFYTSHNKGFAPIFTWQPTAGKSITGSVHLPAFPAYQYGQMQDWNVPGSKLVLHTELRFDEVIIDPERPSFFRTPRQHVLVLRHGDASHELRPGESVSLPGGRLTYQELRTWMGFTVGADWTLPWLLATGLFAVMSLGWHYWRKCAARPWLAIEPPAR